MRCTGRHWKESTDPGLPGGTTGGVLGVAGDAISTYVGINNTNGPRERVLVIRASFIAWMAITVFLVQLLTLPEPYDYLMWVVYGIALPAGIVKLNKKHAGQGERESGTLRIMALDIFRPRACAATKGPGHRYELWTHAQRSVAGRDMALLIIVYYACSPESSPFRRGVRASGATT